MVVFGINCIIWGFAKKIEISCGGQKVIRILKLQLKLKSSLLCRESENLTQYSMHQMKSWKKSN